MDKRLREILSKYSLDDLARSLFTLNMWIPNVGSPIKIEYLYVALECCAGSLAEENSVHSHDEFRELCNSLLAALPNLDALEDYAPEADWGEIRYFHDDRFFKMFYGANLCNPYDFYSAFEVTHFGFDQEYRRLLGRSPKSEVGFCLSVQDYIITILDQSDWPRPEVIPGRIEVPPEEFWKRSNEFLTKFPTDGKFEAAQLDQYSHVVGVNEPVPWPDQEQFAARCCENENCCYFFIKAGETYYPVLPRKYLTVLYGTWGTLLQNRYDDISDRDPKADENLDKEVSGFIRQRLKLGSELGMVSAVTSDSRPHSLRFVSAIQSRNRLFLIHTVPLSRYLDDLSAYLEELVEPLSEAQTLMSKSPSRLMFWSIGQIAECRDDEQDSTLEPRFLITTPYLSTRTETIDIPKKLPGVVLPIDQLLGIVDEVKSSEDFADFFEYWNQIRSSTRMIPLNSALDAFASYRYSDSVLIDGVASPSLIVLDFHWGTGYRYESLLDFWSKFPAINFMGHPRSWAFLIDGSPNLLRSRSFRGYVYFREVGMAVCFINTPVPLIEPSAVPVVRLVIESLADALGEYNSEISSLRMFSEAIHLQVLCIPSSAVSNSPELSHLKQFVPKDSLWQLDATVFEHQHYIVRLVFDDSKFERLLINAKDRSVQIDLLVSVLTEMNTLIEDGRLESIVESLMSERGEKNRFRLFEIQKPVSFPDVMSVTIPGAHDYKVADKSIAYLASTLGISPGDFEGSKAKDTVVALRNGLVTLIGDQISVYDFARAMPFLLSNIDGMVHDHKGKELQVKDSIDREVEYDRESRHAEEKQDFLHIHRTHRYLIEKLVQLRPSGDVNLKPADLRGLLALSERLQKMYFASDALHYGILPATLFISNEFVVSIGYAPELETMERDYTEEQSKIRLGLTGCMDDVPQRSGPGVEYLEELNRAFVKDMGFGLKDVASVGRVLSLWATVGDVEESGSYAATMDEIAAACSQYVNGFDSSQLGAIIDFLTLRSEDVLRVDGQEDDTPDVPVWEHAKRMTRYTIRPIVRIGDLYIWGPYSISKAVELWTGIAHSHKLPAPLAAPATKAMVQKAHEDLESAMELKCKEIVDRHTEHTCMNLFPHKLDVSIADIGDFDVLALFADKGIVIAIESKIVDQPYCMKDTRRLREKIFGREKSDGTMAEGYLQKAEARHNYLKPNAAKLIAKLGWPNSSAPIKVMSLFVTQDSYWWTRFPLLTTEVQFVESRLLGDFLRDLAED